MAGPGKPASGFALGLLAIRSIQQLEQALLEQVCSIQRSVVLLDRRQLGFVASLARRTAKAADRPFKKDALAPESQMAPAASGLNRPLTCVPQAGQVSLRKRRRKKRTKVFSSNLTSRIQSPGRLSNLFSRVATRTGCPFAGVGYAGSPQRNRMCGYGKPCALNISATPWPLHLPSVACCRASERPTQRYKRPPTELHLCAESQIAENFQEDTGFGQDEEEP